jgi:hypothetical protein
MVQLIQKITLEEIRASKPKRIFYGALTCWWTHDPAHLSNTRDFSWLRGELPCDPRGAMLFETNDVEGFLKAAEEGAMHYGEFGVLTFLSAHHLNCIHTEAGHWSFPAWEPYSAILKEQGGKLLEAT